MDIALRTHDAAHALELRDATWLPDAKSWQFRLLVRSDGFAADRPLWVERFVVEQCLEQLRVMDRTLAGSALLQPYHELDRVALELTRTGAVRVHGELGNSTFNQLRFEFLTDQTCLRPLISDFEELCARDPAAV